MKPPAVFKINFAAKYRRFAQPPTSIEVDKRDEKSQRSRQENDPI